MLSKRGYGEQAWVWRACAVHQNMFCAVEIRRLYRPTKAQSAPAENNLGR